MTPLETLILDVARCFCQGWGAGQVAPWDAAFQLADQQLGPFDGPIFVGRVFALMRSVMKERRAAFSHHSPGCPCICRDEQSLLTVIRCAPELEEASFQQALAELVGNIGSANTAYAATALSNLCSRYRGLQRISGEPRRIHAGTLH
jgi:hypothetical protein